LSCDIDEDNLDCQQVVLYLDQTCCEKKIWITRVLLPENQWGADTVISRSLLSNLGHPASTIVPQLLKHPKVNYQHSMQFRCCTHPGASTSHCTWWPQCSSTKCRWRSPCSAIATGDCWGWDMVHDGYYIHKNSHSDHFWWVVLNGWWCFETLGSSSGLSADINRCCCWDTICVSVAWWSISWNWSRHTRSSKVILLFSSPELDLWWY
jgi:hypothetical protein